MEMKKIRAVLRLLDGTDITEFEYEDEAVRLRVGRGAAAGPALVAAPFAAAASAAPVAAAPEAAAAPAESGHGVTSPFVGTFYRSPSPDSPPFTMPSRVSR